ncbi:MAG TPA: lytic transglycosylase domain-containing protein [Candidatus Hydrogenedentes bacterium]|nr:lytic transglycosylase domain-containing protein [Candidatus Hydrogenedentota bacterium]
MSGRHCKNARIWGFALLWALAASWCVAMDGRATSGMEPESREQALQQRRVRLEQENRERAKAYANARPEQRIRIFKDKNGVPTFTDNPSKYLRKSREYVEIAIHYDPIVVPNRLKTLSERDKISAGNLSTLVQHYARMYSLDEHLVYAIIKVESNFVCDAVSRAGARGLMQLMPGTAAEMGVADIYDPAQNIAGGTQYIAKMLNYFNNDMKLSLAAYNSGPETVKKYGGIPPIRETQEYVKRVLHYQKEYKTKGVVGIDVTPGKARIAIASKPAPVKKYFTVVFKSQLTQYADRVVEEDVYYYLNFEGRTARVPKDVVQEIIAPS